jgi:hypothetical protein
MPKRKTQKVQFRKGDRRPRPDKDYTTLSYRKRLIKRGKKMIWNVTEYPTKTVIGEYFFEEDADKLTKFQNKHKVWHANGGIPKFLTIKI